MKQVIGALCLSEVGFFTLATRSPIPYLYEKSAGYFAVTGTFNFVKI
ncbi:hypothetical protein [Bacteroides sp.]|nr:hypothetical protein [Bacteroides sp.]MBP6066194.1 hypothetical protein [Bacteroides sp.]MBP8622797.1 hypothetical protein [Bacteroides sp.]MBP9507058.1 hypothetical protein [Bacteroides sp.]MBP9586824.1 hypothetical protein [Bacteroides sp.]